jgi:hypothetical protein
MAFWRWQISNPAERSGSKRNEFIELTRIRRKFVFKGVKVYVYHDFPTRDESKGEGSMLVYLSTPFSPGKAEPKADRAARPAMEERGH